MVPLLIDEDHFVPPEKSYGSTKLKMISNLSSELPSDSCGVIFEV